MIYKRIKNDKIFFYLSSEIRSFNIILRVCFIIDSYCRKDSWTSSSPTIWPGRNSHTISNKWLSNVYLNSLSKEIPSYFCLDLPLILIILFSALKNKSIFSSMTHFQVLQRQLLDFFSDQTFPVL